MESNQISDKINVESYNNLDSCINASYHFASIKSRLASHPNKKQKLDDTKDKFVPILFGILIKNCRKRNKTLRILLDSGANESLIQASLVNQQQISETKKNVWNTMAGKFATNTSAKIAIKLPELSNSAEFSLKAHVISTESNYDLIIGRDFLSQIGIILNFQDHVITYKHVDVNMKPYNADYKEHFFIQDSKPVQESTSRMKKILDAKYEKADLIQITENLKYLNREKQKKLLKLLKRYEDLFDGTLGTWQGNPYHVELKPGMRPYHAKPFPIPKAYEQTLRKEVDRLIQLGVLKKVNNSEWAAPLRILPYVMITWSLYEDGFLLMVKVEDTYSLHTYYIRVNEWSYEIAKNP